MSRSPDDKPAQTGKGTPISAQRESGVMTLDQVKLSVGDSIQLQFQSDIEHVRALECIIRSVNASRPAEDEKPGTLHGLSFEALTSQDTLVISTMLYQNMISAQASDL